MLLLPLTCGQHILLHHSLSILSTLPDCVLGLPAFYRPLLPCRRFSQRRLHPIQYSAGSRDTATIEQISKCGWQIPNRASDTAVFVDVGGGNGQTCVEFRQKYPNPAGRAINQDLQASAMGILSDGVEHQDYDFFTEQPVVDASA